MFSIDELIRKKPEQYLLLVVAERNEDGIARKYNVIDSSPTLQPLVDELSGLANSEGVVILPTFEEDEESPKTLMPPELYVRLMRVHYNQPVWSKILRIL